MLPRGGEAPSVSGGIGDNSHERFAARSGRRNERCLNILIVRRAWRVCSAGSSQLSTIDTEKA